jgi:hypothetical protein
VSDEGFGRNLRSVFGVEAEYAEYADMADKPLASVAVSVDKEFLAFTFQDGSTAVFSAEGDCCSHSWIEHLTVPDDVAGCVIEAIEDSDSSRDDDDPEHDCLQVYHTKFRTRAGDIVVEYRNSSNGYYGGYLSRVMPAAGVMPEAGK